MINDRGVLSGVPDCFSYFGHHRNGGRSSFREGWLMAKANYKSEYDIIQEVLEALREYRVEIAEPYRLRFDGQLCRFATTDKDKASGRRNGWLICFTNGPRPVVVFGDWSTGESRTVVIGGQKGMTEQERVVLQYATQKAREERERQREREWRATQMKALTMWETASAPMPDHPYLISKRIDGRGLKQRGECLLVPMRDSSGNLWNVQTISPLGKKRFQRHGRFLETYFCLGPQPEGHILICEGMATAKTLHADTGLPAVAAMSTANLDFVASSFRARYPDARITLCADNDERPDKENVGIKAARGAALAVGGYLAIPQYAGDFNDMAVMHGLNAEVAIYDAIQVR